jgi:hypothetical protein
MYLMILLFELYDKTSKQSNRGKELKMNTIHEILNDFALINSRPYVGNDYQFLKLSAITEKGIIAEWKDRFKLEEEDILKLIPLLEWRVDFLSENLLYWFEKIPDKHKEEVFNSKRYIIDLLMNEFGGEPTAVYLLQENINGYYACSSEEYIFVTAKGTFALSLQVHD